MILPYLSADINKFFVFVVVGVITFFVNYFSFYTLAIMNKIGSYQAISISYLITTTTHYLLNRKLTFKAKNGQLKSIRRYLLMLVINYLITLFATVIYLKILEADIKFLIFFTSLSTMLSSFLIMNHFVFRRV